ncbi:MAG: TetR/AcrR family transcriptional regulator [Acidobacteriia bacterium]|nr:TetR/AcrR family transcriptional regulator [Terriglobia bacterium]
MTDQSVSERKRCAILDAARAVFSHKGYSEASVDDVAEHAGIAKGTLYLYFKSKERLYLDALASDLRAMSAEAKQEMERAGTLRDKLRAFLRVRLEYATSRESFLRIYLAEYGSLFVKTAISPDLIQLLRENMRYVAGVIAQAKRRGEIRTVAPYAVAAAFFDISRGLLERRLLGWKEFRAADEIEFAIQLLFSGIQNAEKGNMHAKRSSKREAHRAKIA